jgi:hypothetical protein
MDHIRIIELLKKASKLTDITASEIHSGNPTEAITFIRMVIASILRDEGVRVSVIADAFDKSVQSVYNWLGDMKVPGRNATALKNELLKP